MSILARLLDLQDGVCYTLNDYRAASALCAEAAAIKSNGEVEIAVMERIKTLETRDMCESAKNGGCGECQTSCQSACKTSCGVANQQCENK